MSISPTLMRLVRCFLPAFPQDFVLTFGIGGIGEGGDWGGGCVCCYCKRCLWLWQLCVKV